MRQFLHPFCHMFVVNFSSGLSGDDSRVYRGLLFLFNRTAVLCIRGGLSLFGDPFGGLLGLLSLFNRTAGF